MDYNFMVNDIPITTVWETFGDNEGLGNLKHHHRMNHRLTKLHRFLRKRLNNKRMMKKS